jgi:hypothetical protein
MSKNVEILMASPLWFCMGGQGVGVAQACAGFVILTFTGLYYLISADAEDHDRMQVSKITQLGIWSMTLNASAST